MRPEPNTLPPNAESLSSTVIPQGFLQVTVNIGVVGYCSHHVMQFFLEILVCRSRAKPRDADHNLSTEIIGTILRASHFSEEIRQCAIPAHNDFVAVMFGFSWGKGMAAHCNTDQL